jgi:hypothetical protein
MSDVFRIVEEGDVAGARHNDPFQAGTEKPGFRDKTP